MFLNFSASGSDDVIGYKLYAEEVPNEVTYSSPSFDLGMPVFDEQNQCKIDMLSIPGIGVLDGDFNLGITAVDDYSNESTILTDGLNNVTLDFAKPDPPTNASVSVE